MTERASSPPALSADRLRPQGVGALPWLVLLAAVAAIFLLELALGVVWIPLRDVFSLLLGFDASVDRWHRIVLDFRLPRTLTALTAGAALGVCGLLLQTTFRNPLADPWFFGLVHSARLGVALFVVISGSFGSTVLASLGLLSNLGLALSAGLGALAMTSVLLALAPRVGAVTLLLSGLMLGQAASGLVSVVLHFTTSAQSRAFAQWNDGTFVHVGFSQWSLLVSIVALGFACSVVLAKPLNVLLLGENYAHTLGLAVERSRRATVAVAAVLAGAVTAFCGPVAFLGILAPHLARVFFRSADHRVLLPATALVGAGLAALADLIVHLPWSRHFLHLNAMLGLVGGPTVVLLLLRGYGTRESS
ncbi:MAG: iron ABC transporter permease [Acidobacteriota bacterium]